MQSLIFCLIATSLNRTVNIRLEFFYFGCFVMQLLCSCSFFLLIQVANRLRTYVTVVGKTSMIHSYYYYRHKYARNTEFDHCHDMFASIASCHGIQLPWNDIHYSLPRCTYPFLLIPQKTSWDLTVRLIVVPGFLKKKNTSSFHTQVNSKMTNISKNRWP